MKQRCCRRNQDRYDLARLDGGMHEPARSYRVTGVNIRASEFEETLLSEESSRCGLHSTRYQIPM